MAFNSIPLDLLSRGPEITDLHVVRLGDALRNDGPVTFAEALALTAIEGSPIARHHSWRAFYIDAMLAYMIADTAPEGYIDVAKADRLLALVAPSGRIATPAIFEMLTVVMAHARWLPERLTAAVLDEILCTIAAGDGALRPDGQDAHADAGTITTTDIDRIRHVLYCAANPGMRITAIELRAILAIDAASVSRADGWDGFFVAALADAALTASGYAGPARETVLSPGNGAGTRGDFLAAYRPMSIEERSIEALERQRIAIITGEEPSQFDAVQLSAALDEQPGTPAMKELVATLAVLGPVLHPRLQKLVKDRRTPTTRTGTIRSIRAA